MPVIKKMNVLIGLLKSTNALLVNVLQGGTLDTGIDLGEREQGQE
jgi:hypothetical protein